MLANQFLFSAFITPEALKHQRQEKIGISFMSKDIFSLIWFIIFYFFILTHGF